jgi:hypothetical protein
MPWRPRGPGQPAQSAWLFSHPRRDRTSYAWLTIVLDTTAKRYRPNGAPVSVDTKVLSSAFSDDATSRELAEPGVWNRASGEIQAQHHFATYDAMERWGVTGNSMRQNVHRREIVNASCQRSPFRSAIVADKLRVTTTSLTGSCLSARADRVVLPTIARRGQTPSTLP